MYEFKSPEPVSGHASLIGTTPTLGQVNIMFVDMGQGDCTIISMPNNSIYIVDCGSISRLEPETFKISKETLWAWAKGKTVKLILTHPDADHNNKFIGLLVDTSKEEGSQGLPVDTIYFSRAKNNKAPLAFYKASAILSNIRFLGTPKLVEVTINATKQSKKTWTFDEKLYRKDPVVSKIEDSELVLQKGTLSGDRDWKISIIAGNVETVSKTASILSNVVSLCTLVQLDKTKLVLTGDATSETLAFLEKTHWDTLDDAEILQLPHHGSEFSVMSEDLVKCINPSWLVVSVGWANTKHSLPKYNALNAFKGARLKGPDLDIDYWKKGETGFGSIPELKSILSERWKPYTIEHSSSFHVLSDPEDAVKAGTPFYGFSDKGNFLYRRSVKKKVYLTGLHGTKFLNFT